MKTPIFQKTIALAWKALVLLLALHPSISLAETYTYTYTGNHFSSISVTPPGTTPNVTTSDNISITIVSPVLLSQSSNLANTNGLSYTVCLTPGDCLAYPPTDSSITGNITFSAVDSTTNLPTQWSVNLDEDPNTADFFHLSSTNQIVGGAVTAADTYAFEGVTLADVTVKDQAQITGDPGTWTLTKSKGCTNPGKFEVCTIQAVIQPCASADYYAICHPVCDHPCSDAVVSWAVPVSGAVDPSFNGISIYALAATLSDASRLVGRLNVIVSAQSAAQDATRHATQGQVIDRGASGLGFVMLAPLVDMGARTQTHSSGLATPPPTVQLAIPYAITRLSPGASVKLVEFDRRKNRWMDVEGQFVDAARHIVTARVTAAGRFTVVNELPSH